MSPLMVNIWTHLHVWCPRPSIATLGSIFDSQLSWEFGKYQLARWSHRVVIFPHSVSSWNSQLSWESCKFQLVRWGHEVVIFSVQNNHLNLLPEGKTLLLLGVCWVSGGGLEDILRLSERCLCMSGGFLEGVWGCVLQNLGAQNFLDIQFSGHTFCST